MRVAQARRFVISDHPLPWLLPLVAILLVFTVYPLLYNIWLSFHEFVPRRRALEFVGTENWVQLWNDTRFWQSLVITFTYFAIALTFELVLGMAIALLLDSDGFGFGFLRGVLTMTLVIPPAIVGMMYLLMEDPQFGRDQLLPAINRPSQPGQSDPRHGVDRSCRRSSRGNLAVDAVHGSHLPCGPQGAAAGAL